MMIKIKKARQTTEGVGKFSPNKNCLRKCLQKSDESKGECSRAKFLETKMKEDIDKLLKISNEILHEAQLSLGTPYLSKKFTWRNGADVNASV